LDARLAISVPYRNDVRAAGLVKRTSAQVLGRTACLPDHRTGVAAPPSWTVKSGGGSHGLAGEIGHVSFNPDGRSVNAAQRLPGGIGFRSGIAARAASKARTFERFAGGFRCSACSDLTAQRVFGSRQAGGCPGTGDGRRDLPTGTSHPMAALSYDPQVIVLGGGFHRPVTCCSPLSCATYSACRCQLGIWQYLQTRPGQLSTLGETADPGATALFGND